MNLQNLVQQKLQEKALSKAAKKGSKRTSIPLNKITDPSTLGSGALASIMDSDNNESVRDAAQDGVEKTLAQVKSGNLEDLEAIKRQSSLCVEWSV